ncbi:MAG TPA: alpha/beta fold hydrolase [Pyrinomonadaceae bacterium]|nr:alpha/beta fold hydrolase [Pyrinomonadaceae bacterium]
MSDALINMESEFRHGYAQVGDVRLHYVEHGAGERLVVLLHGFPECWYSWRHQLKALGARYRVVAPDLRGYNLSDKPKRVSDYRVEKLVDDVTGLIRHFGAREAAVVGHDWGAAVAWSVAQRFPEYVWKMAALQVPPGAAWARNVTLRQLVRSWYMFFFQLPAVPEWVMRRGDFRGLGETLRRTSRPGTFTDKDINVLKAALRQPGALTAAINYYRANVLSLLLRRGPRGAVEGEVGADGRVRVPVLFIYGEQDFAIIPETVRGVADFVDAPYREVRLARANHWVQQEYPSEVNAALLSFLDEQ